MAKRTDFTVEEVELLRGYVRDLGKRLKLTQAQIGALMGVNQQNASAFLKNGAHAGIGRTSANALAVSQGFANAEELLSELRSLAAANEEALGVGNVWHSRDSARRIVEALGVSPAAIQAVVDERRSPSDAKRSVKWWVMEFLWKEQRTAAK